VSAPAAAAFRCYYCEIELRRFTDAETFKPDGKRKAFRVRCVDRKGCDVRIAEARRAVIAAAKEMRNADGR
jgi:hypothetical protein